MNRIIVFTTLLLLLLTSSSLPLWVISQQGSIVDPNSAFFNHPNEEDMLRRDEDMSSFLQLMTGPRVFLSRYFEQFRLDYFFFPAQEGSFPIPGVGIIPPIVSPFLAIGLYVLVRDRKKSMYKFILSMIFLVPLLSISSQPPTFFGLVGMTTVFSLVGAVGLTEFVFWRKKQRLILFIFVIGALLLSIWYPWHQYVAHFVIFHLM